MQTTIRKRTLLLLVAALVLGAASLACSTAGVLQQLIEEAAESGEPERPVIVVTRLVTATPVAPPTPEPAGTALPSAPEDGAEIESLLAGEIPAADMRDLALRLDAEVDAIPTVVNAVPPSYDVGDTAPFWVINSDTQEHAQVTATLRYMTAHVAMWVADGSRVDLDDLKAAADRFEKKIYPTNREFFGSEWSPGIDNDVRLHILHSGGLGEYVAGYYSSADEYSRLINPYSNEREMFYISTDPGSAAPNSDFYNGTLAHEFQHMIHWANDPNEDSWVNEGMSELASYLNDFDPGGHDASYSAQPDTQLTTWSDMEEGNSEHYGASYLFTQYFLDRFGEELTKAVVASTKNGIAGYNEALAASGRPERFDEIFADWVVANYLDSPDADDEGRYGYPAIDPRPMELAFAHGSFPVTKQTRVSQYGADYIRLRGEEPVTIRFEGAQTVGLVEAAPRGERSWWSNRGDQSDATLTRAFDLTGASSAMLTFAIWYDIEEGWDYAYVEVSTDGGRHWDILEGKHTTTEDPVGNAFGPGWTGVSGGGTTPKWIEERVDLTPYAGQEILVRFESVTDDAVNLPGMLLDDIAISEIGYAYGGEDGDGGWESRGWVLTDNVLEQRWLVQLIEVADERVTVQRMEIGADGRGQLTTSDLGELTSAILVVSGSTPITTQPAAYGYTIEE